MEKVLLKTVIASLETGAMVKILMRGAGQPVRARFDGSRRGKGKGGSLIAEFSVFGENEHDAPTQLILSSPKNEDVLSIQVGDVTHGLSAFQQLPTKVNPEVSEQLKLAFNRYISHMPVGLKVQFDTTDTTLSQGPFTVLAVQQGMGKFGQLEVKLACDENGEEFTFYTHRHSGNFRGMQIYRAGGETPAISIAGTPN